MKDKDFAVARNEELIDNRIKDRKVNPPHKPMMWLWNYDLETALFFFKKNNRDKRVAILNLFDYKSDKIDEDSVKAIYIPNITFLRGKLGVKANTVTMFPSPNTDIYKEQVDLLSRLMNTKAPYAFIVPCFGSNADLAVKTFISKFMNSNISVLIFAVPDREQYNAFYRAMH